MRWLVALGIVAVAVAGGGWWFVGRPALAASGSASHRLAVEWRGSQRGTVSLPVVITWCPVTRQGMIEAVALDTGVAVVLYEADSLTAGLHPVFSPDYGSTNVPRPSATAALRWVHDSVLLGFRSQSGRVDLTREGDLISGTFEVSLRRPERGDTLLLRGAFDKVPVLTTAAGCTSPR